MRNKTCSLLTFLGLLVLNGQVRAQSTRDTHGEFFKLSFTRDWDFLLQEKAKLIELDTISDSNKDNLVLLIDGKQPGDTKRRLMVTHWDGFRFAEDSAMDFAGKEIDTLISGKFRDTKAPPDPRFITIQPAHGIHGTSSFGSHQIVTSEGVYGWGANQLTRLFAAPLDVKLALILEKEADRLVTGAGDTAATYIVGDNYTRESTVNPPSAGPGFVRFGVGNQTFSASDKMDFAPGVRYMQSVWNWRNKWVVGILSGTPLSTPEAPAATTGDRLVVYSPKFSARSKSFWATRKEDYQENWRSEPLPGRVLDIRVGDPKNEGREGILVLTAENNDKDRHLYFYKLAQ